MMSEKIRNLRRVFNINQVELANKLCVIKQCVSNWENDNILPSVDMLIKLAKFFNVSTDYLLGLDSDNQLGEITYWLLGTFSKVTMNEVYIMLPIVALSITILFLIGWRINIISFGAIFMIICDIISRSFTFSEIPLSVVTGFVGTPVFVYTLFLRRNKIDDVVFYFLILLKFIKNNSNPKYGSVSIDLIFKSKLYK